MPTPSKFEEIISVPGNEPQFQNNAFRNHDTSVLNENVFDESGMALVAVDEEKLQAKTVQPHKAQQG